MQRCEVAQKEPEAGGGSSFVGATLGKRRGVASDRRRFQLRQKGRKHLSSTSRCRGPVAGVQYSTAQVPNYQPADTPHPQFGGRQSRRDRRALASFCSSPQTNRGRSGRCHNAARSSGPSLHSDDLTRHQSSETLKCSLLSSRSLTAAQCLQACVAATAFPAFSRVRCPSNSVPPRSRLAGRVADQCETHCRCLHRESLPSPLAQISHAPVPYIPPGNL